MAGRITVWTLGAVLSALYLAALITPIGNLLYLPQSGLTISPIGWVLLYANVALPVVGFGIALVLARRASAPRRLLALLTALALVALVQFEQNFVVPPALYFVV